MLYNRVPGRYLEMNTAAYFYPDKSKKKVKKYPRQNKKALNKTKIKTACAHTNANFKTKEG